MFAAIWSLHQRGYGYLALILAVLALAVLLSLSRESMEGLILSWHQGSWTFERGGVRWNVVPGPRYVCTSWVIYLPVIDPSIGRVEHLWLYADSIPREQLRRLRVRLALEQ